MKIECRRNLTSFPDAFTASLPARPTGAADTSGAHGAVGVGADDALWGPGLTCHENGRELSFRFGEDGFVYCGWHLANEDMYKFAAAVMRGEQGWQCRVPMSKDRSFYLPMPLSLWGVVEPGHMHINYHYNFIFHVDEGRIIGAAAYPVRDRFQYTRVRSTLNLHGPVKWFNKHSFLAVGQAPLAVEAAARVADGTSAVAVFRTDTRQRTRRERCRAGATTRVTRQDD